jgi:hypothetical protein
MRSTRIATMLIVVAAALAASAIASATASALPALPEFVKGKAKEAAKGVKYTSTSGESILENEKEEKIKCSADTDEGEITGPSTSTSTVHFTGCTFDGVSCKTKGAKAGEIITEASGTLYWINEKSKEPGLALEAKEKEITCLFITKKAKGCALGRISPLEKLTKNYELVFNQTKGKGEPDEYEDPEGTKHVCKSETEGSGSGLKSTDKLEFKEEVELL